MFRTGFPTSVAIATAVPVLTSLTFACDPIPPIHDLATKPKVIFIGTVVDHQQDRDRLGHTWTKITFSVDHLVAGKEAWEEEITLRQPGTLGRNATRVHGGLPDWEQGETYLVFAQDPTKSFVSPIYGGAAGCFQLFRDGDQDDQSLYPIDRYNRPLVGIKDGMPDFARPVTAIDNGVATLRTGEPFFDAPTSSDPAFTARTMTFDGTAEILDVEEFLQIIHRLRGERAKTIPQIDSVGTFEAVGGVAGLDVCVCGWSNMPYTYEQVPTWYDGYDNNEWSAQVFNTYMDMHLLEEDTDNTWVAYWNGTNELCGFTSDFLLHSAYDRHYGTAIAINRALSGDGCDQILENEIHLNPLSAGPTVGVPVGPAWSFSFADAFNSGTGSFLYDNVMLHEMGHSLGLEAGGRDGCNEDYQFDRPTIMSRISRTYAETGRGLHRRDIARLRQTYGSGADPDIPQIQVKEILDMGVESWWMNGNIALSRTLPAGSFVPGDTVTTENILVENMSTAPVPNVRIRVFFSDDIDIDTDVDYPSSNAYFWSTFSYNADWSGSLDWTIPTNIPDGRYYVGLVVTAGGGTFIDDQYPENNVTFITRPITIAAASGLLPPMGLSGLTASFGGMRLYVSTSSDEGTEAPNGPPTCGTAVQANNDQWTFTATEDGVLAVHRLDTFAEGEGFTGLFPDMVTVYERFGEFVHEEIATYCSTYQESPALFPIYEGSEYMIEIGSVVDGPENDSWYRAVVVPQQPWGSTPEKPLPDFFNNEQTLEDMSSESFDLPCTETPSTHGKWYAYQAEMTGTLFATTCFGYTNFNSVVSIHDSTGPEYPVIGCALWSDPECGLDEGATASAEVEAGQTVLIRVATQDTPGNFMLAVAVDPDSDAQVTCENAPLVQAGIVPFFTKGNDAAWIPNCDDDFSLRRSTWMSFVAESNGVLIASTCASTGGSTNGPTTVSIHSGECGTLTPLACDNAGCANSAAQTSVTKGERYYIAVSNRHESLGSAGIRGSLAIQFTPNVTCPTDLNGDDIVDGADLALLLGSWGTSKNDLDGNDTVDGADLALVLGTWGACP